MLLYYLLEYSSNYSDARQYIVFYSKDEVTNFNADIAGNNAFKYFSYINKLLGNVVPDRNNGVLRNTAIFLTLKYLSNFLTSLKMPFINCTTELKRK